MFKIANLRELREEAGPFFETVKSGRKLAYEILLFLIKKTEEYVEEKTGFSDKKLANYKISEFLYKKKTKLFIAELESWRTENCRGTKKITIKNFTDAKSLLNKMLEGMQHKRLNQNSIGLIKSEKYNYFIQFKKLTPKEARKAYGKLTINQGKTKQNKTSSAKKVEIDEGQFGEIKDIAKKEGKQQFWGLIVGTIGVIATIITLVVNSETTTVRQGVKTQPAPIVNQRQENSQLIKNTKKPIWKFLHEPNNFVIRKEKLKKLHKLLMEGKRRQSVSGLAGMGKTRFAVDYFYTYQTEYPAGILWIKAEKQILEQYALLRNYLNLKYPPYKLGLENQCNEVKQQLEQLQYPSLLVLENLNDKQDYEKIKNYLPTHPSSKCRILITSERNDLVPGVELTSLPADEALELLIAKSEEPKMGNAGKLICEMLGNLPLALELAGSYFKERKKLRPMFSVEQYAKEFEKGNILTHSFQKHGNKSILQAALSVNNELLDNPDIQKVLAALICFAPESINYQLLQSIVDLKTEIFDHSLIQIRKYSLVKVQKHGRLNLHRLLREAIAEQLDKEMIEKFQERFVSVFTDWSDKKYNDVTKLKEVTLEISHLIEAANLAEKRKLWPNSFKLVHNLGDYYGKMGWHKEKIKWLAPQEDRLRRKNDHYGLSVLSNSLGVAWHNLGKHHKAIDYFKQALSMINELSGGQPSKVANALIAKITSNLGLAWNSALLANYRQLPVRIACKREA